jgi:hypothetical protein
MSALTSKTAAPCGLASPKLKRQQPAPSAKAGLGLHAQDMDLARDQIMVSDGKIGKASKTRRAVPELVYSVCITPALETAMETQLQQRERPGADRAPASAGMSSYEQSVFAEI